MSFLQKVLKLSFVFQIGLKLIAIALGVLIYRWQNTNFSENELADLTKITAYTTIIFGFINFGIPQIIQKFYTNNLFSQTKKVDFASFWNAFLALRILSYFLGILLIFLTFRLSNTANLTSIIGIFTAQFILILDINFRSICDATGRSWQFSLTDFLGKLLLVLGLFWISLSKLNQVFFKIQILEISTFNWFVICSIIAYLSALALDFWLQREFVWFDFSKIINLDSISQVESSINSTKQKTSFTKKSINNLSKSFQNWYKIWQNYRREIFFLGFSAFIAGLFLRTDILFLSFSGINKNSLIGYSNSYRLFEVASVVPTLIAPVLASQLFQKLKTQKIKNPKNNLQILVNFIARISLVGLFCTFLLIIFAPFGLLIIDPQKRFYKESLIVIWPLSFILFCSGISSFVGNLSIFLGNSSFELISSCLNLVAATFFYLLLIPSFGTTGAAFASLFIFIFDLFCKIFFFVKIWKRSQFY